MRSGGEGGVRELLVHTASSTSMHGLPRVYSASTKVRRIIWAFILLLGVGIMVWQTTEAFLKYFRWPTETTITLNYLGNMPFPAISICNLNPVRKNLLHTVGDINDFINTENTEEEGNGDDELMDLETAANSSDYFTTMDETFVRRANFQILMSSLTVEDRMDIGHRLKDMLIECSFGGVRCTANNFTYFLNPVYGNCYTFNVFDNDQTSDTVDWADLNHLTKIGPGYGLEMILFVEEDEYVFLSKETGLKIAIHNQTTMPFPEDLGVSIPTGLAVNVGLRRKEIIRASYPHGTCLNLTGDDVIDDNMYIDFRKYLAYTAESCKKTCLQFHLIDQCDCGDPYLPRNSSTFYHTDLWPDIPACSSEHRRCEDRIYDEYASNNLNCTKECHFPCLEVQHSESLSFATWPSMVIQDSVIKQLMRSSNTTRHKMSKMTPEQKVDYAKRNLVNLKIYFEDLSVTTIKTSKSYTEIDLLGDLGGLVGLYLGLSVLTIFEFMELIFDVFYFCCRRQPVDTAKTDDKTISLDDQHREKTLYGSQ